MRREKFIERYEAASTEVNEEDYYRIITESMDPNPLFIGTGTRNLVIVMEEITELIQQIVANIEHIGEDNLGLIEELADVKMGLTYVEIVCEITKDEISKVSVEREYLKVLPIESEYVTTNELLKLNCIYLLTDLSQQISKFLRGKVDKEKMILCVSNTYVVLNHIKSITFINEEEINKAINVKLDRLNETEGYYR